MDNNREESEDVILVQKLKSFMHKEARGNPTFACFCLLKNIITVSHLKEKNE